MKLPFSLFMSLRYLRGKHRHKLISIITLFSILGIAIGVMALMVVISVMEGFDRDLKKRILGVYAPITIGGNTLIEDSSDLLKEVEKIEGVTGASAFVTGQIMARMGHRVAGILVRGVDPDMELRSTQIGVYMIEGDFRFPDYHGIVIGKEFSHRFSLGLGDSLELLSPIAIPTPLGLSSHSVRFQVVGIFESGMYEYDLNLVYCSIASAQELYGIGSNVHGITVNIKDVEKATTIKEKIRDALPRPIRVKTWLELNRNLFQALVMEKWLIFWILLLIVLVAAFNITSSLIMMVMEKTKEVGILKALGATKGLLLRIFVLQGFVIGLVGTCVGFVCGLAITMHLNTITAWITKWTGLKFFPKDIYYLNKIPTHIDFSHYLIIALCALGISLLAAVYPALRAARLDPVDAIRYE